jgi:3-hydroxy-3-methylglutaryl CoA synthase/uncharacterized OB-fold protein
VVVSGIVGYGAYLPHFRLQRGAVGETLGSGGGRGSRAVASHDEDATSMAVEAGRVALRSTPGVVPASVLFATTSPPYLDKTNATAIRAALGFDHAGGAYDMVGSVRSAVGALHAAAGTSEPTLVVAGDVRTGLPGGADEVAGGDGASALLFGADGVIAEILATAAASEEFLDRWRVPGEPASRRWEERFAEGPYVVLAEAAMNDALKRAGVNTADLDHVIVTGVHARAVRRVAKGIGARAEALVDDLSATVGNTGAAHPGLLLASVLDHATPGALIALVLLADGADALVLRTTDTISEHRAQRGVPTVAEAVAAGDDSLAYATFLTWRGMLQREPPRRPDLVAPAAPPSLRRRAWKYGFTASRCEACGTRHLPPARVCVECDAVDQMAPERLADVAGRIATYTVDRLAFSLNPPVVVGVIDFAGGGRFQCEMTDVDPADVHIGDRVEMTFRRLFTANGVHNYFWKAKPVRGES